MKASTDNVLKPSEEIFLNYLIRCFAAIFGYHKLNTYGCLYLILVIFFHAHLDLANADSKTMHLTVKERSIALHKMLLSLVN